MRYYPTIVILLFTFSMCSCSATRSVVKNDPQSDESGSNLISGELAEGTPQNWDNLFRRVPGVQVRGSYPDLSLLIRGAKTLQGDTEPLFVLEGVPLGREFSSLARAANPNDVASIRVLKGTQASLYGARGANGVVVVKLKSE